MIIINGKAMLIAVMSVNFDAELFGSSPAMEVVMEKVIVDVILQNENK